MFLLVVFFFKYHIAYLLLKKKPKLNVCEGKIGEKEISIQILWKQNLRNCAKRNANFMARK